MFILKTAKVIGTPNGEAWSQVHDFKVDGEKLVKRGRLLVILTLKEVGEGIEAVTAGREILARINEEYYGNLEGTPFERLKEVLKKLNREFGNLQLVAAVFYQNVGYFGVLGGGKVIVKRRSSIHTILNLSPDGQRGNTEALNDTEALKIKIASGFIQERDIFLLGSEKFFEVVAQGTWRAALVTGQIEEMVEILAPIVAGRERVGEVAVGIVKVESGEWKVESGIVEGADKKESLVSVPPGATSIERKMPSVLLKRAQKTPLKLISLFSVVRRAFNKFVRFRPSSIFVRRRDDQQKRKKTLLSVAAVLIFLLLVSIILGIRKRGSEQRWAQTENLIGQIESKLEEGKGLGAIKPAEAKKVLHEAQQLLDQSSKFKAQGSRLKALRGEIEAELAKVVKEHQFSELPVFFDLSLVSQDAKGDDLSLYKDKLAILDKENKRVIEIDISSKAHQILAGGGDLSGATQVALYDDKIYILTENGIWETKAGKTKLVIEKSEKWQEIVDLSVWAGNVYLLDSKAKTIWRHMVIESGFSTAQNWVRETLDLSRATSFTINGSIWVLDRKSTRLPASEAGLLKLTSGGQETFSIIGLEKPLVSPERIFTNETVNNLYILDKGNYRVVVLDKEGNYQASYLWIGIGDVEEMVVSEEKKKILLLAGSKIYEMEIK